MEQDGFYNPFNLMKKAKKDSKDDILAQLKDKQRKDSNKSNKMDEESVG